ncbi:MAG: DUF1361 domain-containing protein [Bacteroidales bacterium]|nr:DUF1361 domain-containing protein [Bacteroidales bacterium]
MFQRLKKYDKLNQTILFLALGIISFAILTVRFIYTESITFVFLVINLILAAIPWVISTILIIFPKIQNKKIIVILFLCVWLLFFPNAPYILTDLFHLRLNHINIWFDLVLILSFAWTGLLFGITSLLDIEEILKKRLNKYFVYIISTILLFIASFGIYLGRFMRWNSWDILNHPQILFFDIFDRLLNPFSHPRTWGMTIFMGIFLNIVFWSIKLLKTNNIKKF